MTPITRYAIRLLILILILILAVWVASTSPENDDTCIVLCN